MKLDEPKPGGLMANPDFANVVKMNYFVNHTKIHLWKSLKGEKLSVQPSKRLNGNGRGDRCEWQNHSFHKYTNTYSNTQTHIQIQIHLCKHFYFQAAKISNRICKTLIWFVIQPFKFKDCCWEIIKKIRISRCAVVGEDLPWMWNDKTGQKG